jgi:hypothetical protein
MGVELCRCPARFVKRTTFVENTEKGPASLGRDGSFNLREERFDERGIGDEGADITYPCTSSGLQSSTMPSVPPVFALVPTTQSYDWGKTGSDSKVAQLASASSLSGFKLDEKTRYAEVSIDGVSHGNLRQ